MLCVGSVAPRDYTPADALQLFRDAKLTQAQLLGPLLLGKTSSNSTPPGTHFYGFIGTGAFCFPCCCVLSVPVRGLLQLCVTAPHPCSKPAGTQVSGRFSHVPLIVVQACRRWWVTPSPPPPHSRSPCQVAPSTLPVAETATRRLQTTRLCWCGRACKTHASTLSSTGAPAHCQRLCLTAVRENVMPVTAACSQDQPPGVVMHSRLFLPVAPASLMSWSVHHALKGWLSLWQCCWQLAEGGWPCREEGAHHLALPFKPSVVWRTVKVLFTSPRNCSSVAARLAASEPALQPVQAEADAPVAKPAIALAGRR